MNGYSTRQDLDINERIIYSDLVNIAKLDINEKAIYNITFIISKDLVFKSRNKDHKITKLAFTEVKFYLII